SRRLRRSVALLSFPGAELVVKRLGWPIPVVGPDDIEVNYRRILIDPTHHHAPEWNKLLARMYMRGLEIESWPSYLESNLGKVDLETFDLSNISYSSSQIFYYKLKRFLDIAGVIVVGIPAAVVCGLLWVYIRIIDGGP